MRCSWRRRRRLVRGAVLLSGLPAGSVATGVYCQTRQRPPDERVRGLTRGAGRQMVAEARL